MVDFGQILKKLRLQEGLTQAQLAAVFHVSTDYLLGLDKKETIDLAGLDEEDIITVKRLLATLRNKSKRS